MGYSFFLTEGPEPGAITIFFGEQATGGYVLGLSGISWLDKVVDWFKSNASALKGVWSYVKGTLGPLVEWAKKQQKNVVVADCGTYFEIEVTKEGVAYRETSDTKGKQIIQANLVPGWKSPCGTPPASPAPETTPTTDNLKKYLPWIVGGGAALILLLGISKR